MRKGRRAGRGRPAAATPKGLGRELLQLVEEGLSDAWAELLAVEAVVAESAAVFGGEEPIHPLAREILDEVTALARELAERLEVVRDG